MRFLVDQNRGVLFIACESGPASTLLETFPPRLEVEQHDSTYVLTDLGPRDAWRYEFVPHGR